MDARKKASIKFGSGKMRTAGQNKTSSVSGSWASHAFYVQKLEQFKEVLTIAQDPSVTAEQAVAALEVAKGLLDSLKAYKGGRMKEKEIWQNMYQEVSSNSPEEVTEFEEVEAEPVAGVTAKGIDYSGLGGLYTQNGIKAFIKKLCTQAGRSKIPSQF